MKRRVSVLSFSYPAIPACVLAASAIVEISHRAPCLFCAWQRIAWTFALVVASVFLVSENKWLLLPFRLALLSVIVIGTIALLQTETVCTPSFPKSATPADLIDSFASSGRSCRKVTVAGIPLHAYSVCCAFLAASVTFLKQRPRTKEEDRCSNV
ncbi:MAG: disulfide bond formation protein B [Simkaniaceae bacterium]|nr:disulfide bond formation protein B [Simkaniaceae bacterium]